jgi:hypothetical protein
VNDGFPQCLELLRAELAGERAAVQIDQWAEGRTISVVGRFAVLHVVSTGEVVILDGQLGDGPVGRWRFDGRFRRAILAGIEVLGQHLLVLFEACGRTVLPEVDIAGTSGRLYADTGLPGLLMEKIGRDLVPGTRHGAAPLTFRGRTTTKYFVVMSCTFDKKGEPKCRLQLGLCSQERERGFEPPTSSLGS